MDERLKHWNAGFEVWLKDLKTTMHSPAQIDLVMSHVQGMNLHADLHEGEELEYCAHVGPVFQHFMRWMDAPTDLGLYQRVLLAQIDHHFTNSLKS